MAGPIEPVTTAALAAALDAAARRHEVIAANIANANTQGYAPVRLDFGAQLAEVRAALHDRGFLGASQVELLRSLPQQPAEASSDSAPVQLDAEMSELARNAMQFQVLLQGLSRHLGMLALAAGDGRR